MVLEKLSEHTVTGGVWFWFFKIKIHSSLAMHEGIYFENSIPVAWPYCVKFCTNSHIFCVASAWTSTFLQKSLLCWHLSFPTYYCGKQNCVLEPRSCLKYSRGSKHAQTPLPSAWLWPARPACLPEHTQARQTEDSYSLEATLRFWHNTIYKLNSVYPAELSPGTWLRDYSCTASFCPCQQQKPFREAVSHHGGSLGEEISSDVTSKEF